jgi:hypothetical protein
VVTGGRTAGRRRGEPHQGREELRLADRRAGRNYDGSIIGQGFSGPDIEDPVAFWVPAIAISGPVDL